MSVPIVSLPDIAFEPKPFLDREKAEHTCKVTLIALGILIVVAGMGFGATAHFTSFLPLGHPPSFVFFGAGGSGLLLILYAYNRKNIYHACNGLPSPSSCLKGNQELKAKIDYLKNDMNASDYSYYGLEQPGRTVFQITLDGHTRKNIDRGIDSIYAVIDTYSKYSRPLNLYIRGEHLRSRNSGEITVTLNEIGV
jgi:hypothetical protein